MTTTLDIESAIASRASVLDAAALRKVHLNLALKIAPGTLVLFNGDKVYHAVTPTREGEERYLVTMQYVTDIGMNPFMRFVSNMKDSIAYFGLKEVFFGRKRS